MFYRKRKDLDKTRIQADEESVKDVIQTLTAMVNPFENDHKGLVHLASRVVATTEVESDMKSMFETGDIAALNFMRKKILSSQPDIYSPIKKIKLKTFSSIGKKVHSKSKKGEIVALKNTKMLFGKMILIAQSRNLDMKEVLKYSLRPFPLPLATNDGNLVKTVKSKLLAAIEAEVHDPCVDQVLGESAVIVDGMAILQTMKGSMLTFGDLATEVLVKVIGIATFSRSRRVDFVCDRYPVQSIKNLEREKRSESGSYIVRIYGGHQHIPRQWKKFMASRKSS